VNRIYGDILFGDIRFFTRISTHTDVITYYIIVHIITSRIALVDIGGTFSGENTGRSDCRSLAVECVPNVIVLCNNPLL